MNICKQEKGLCVRTKVSIVSVSLHDEENVIKLNKRIKLMLNIFKRMSSNYVEICESRKF